jgi:phosphotransferase system IIB component
MLFIIRAEESVFESNPHISTMSAFKGITDEQFRYVAFYADWKSPYRNLPDAQRRDAALLDSGLKSDNGMEKYVKAYLKMQGIENERDNIEALDFALTEIRKRLKSSSSLESDEFKKLSGALVDLAKQRNLIMDMINDSLNIEDLDMQMDEGMSTIDGYGG